MKLVITFVCLLGVGAALGSAAGALTPQEDLKSSVRGAFSAAVENGFSGGVYLGQSGNEILNEGFGLADRNSQTPVSSETVFCIGSITKTFTAVCILQLVQQKKLRLDQPLSELFQDVPPDKSPITIQQLLTHSAGLEDYIDRPGEKGDFTKLSKEEALARIWAMKLKFKPGANSEYSNAGYTLLAIIVEKCSGSPFQKYVREHIFRTAGMLSAGFYGDSIWKKSQAAVGYGRKTESDPNSPDHWPPTSWSLTGAGGIVCSPRDLGRFAEAIIGGRLLDKDRTELMLEAHGPEPTIPEGFGWIVGRTKSGKKFINVGGGNEFGFESALLVFPESGMVLVSITNGGMKANMREVLQSVLPLVAAK